VRENRPSEFMVNGSSTRSRCLPSLPATEPAPSTPNALARDGPAGPELEKAVEVTVYAQPVPGPGASTDSNPAGSGRLAHPRHRRYSTNCTPSLAATHAYWQLYTNVPLPVK
jgi:hypothetical protein